MPRRSSNNGGFIGNGNIADNSQASGIFTLNEAREKVAVNEFPAATNTPQRSLRFANGRSHYLIRSSPAQGTGNRRTWTMSVWLKRTNLSIDAPGILCAGTADGSEDLIQFQASRIRFRFAAGSDNTPNIQLRDLSAWYHIVLAVDTTKTISTERLRWYVNGKEVSVNNNGYYSDHNVFPSLNHDFRINNAQDQYIGRFPRTGDSFDGYMTEFYFIDGLQLTAASFGEYDPRTAEWRPKSYTGSFGSNGYYLPFSDITSLTNIGRNFASQNYITYSEEFNNAAWTKYQSSITADAIVAPDGTTTADKLVGGTGTTGDKQVYRSVSLTSGAVYTLSAYAKAGERTIFRLYGQLRDTSQYAFADFDLTTGIVSNTTNAIEAKTVDVGNGWYRCILTYSAGAGAASSANIYLSYATATAETAGSGLYVWGAQFELGNSASTYIKTVTTTYNSPWTATNFSLTAGDNYDSFVDVPGFSTPPSVDIGGVARGNYPTWDVSNKTASITVSEAGLYAYNNSAADYHAIMATQAAPTSGKVYWEGKIAGYGDVMGFGIANRDRISHAYVSNFTNGPEAPGAYFNWPGYPTMYVPNAGSHLTPAIGDIVNFAYDADSGKLWIGLNGTYYYANRENSDRAPTRTLPGQGPASYQFEPNLPNLVPFLVSYSGSGAGTRGVRVNFGQKPFAYTPPRGFRGWSTSTYPDPAIPVATKHFDIKTYFGNGVGQTIGNIVKENNNYQVNNSIRLRQSNSAHLEYTVPDAFSSRSCFTYSFWVKSCRPGQTQHLITSGNEGAIATNYCMLSLSASGFLDANNTLKFSAVVSNSAIAVYYAYLNLADASKWYNVVVSVDTSLAVDSERIKFYVDGARISRFSSATHPSLNANIPFLNESGYKNYIGRLFNYGYYDGYMTEIRRIDGYAHGPEAFGKYDASGNWTPIEYTSNIRGPKTNYTAFFDGTGDYVDFGNSADFDFGSGDFSIEFWIWPTALPVRHQMLIHKGHPTNNNQYDWRVYWGDTSSGTPNQLWFDSNIGSLPTVSDVNLQIRRNTWNHIAIVREGSSLRGYINGVLTGTATATGTLSNTYTNTYFGVGNVGAAGQTNFNGFAADLRVVKGSVGFTEMPSDLLTAVSNTKLLTFRASTFVDNSGTGKTITASGNAAMTGYGNKYGVTGFYLPFSTRVSLYSETTGSQFTVVSSNKIYRPAGNDSSAFLSGVTISGDFDIYWRYDLASGSLTPGDAYVVGVCALPTTPNYNAGGLGASIYYNTQYGASGFTTYASNGTTTDTSSSGTNPSTTSYVRISRSGSTISVHQGTTPGTWTLIRTFTATYSGDVVFFYGSGNKNQNQNLQDITFNLVNGSSTTNLLGITTDYSGNNKHWVARGIACHDSVRNDYIVDVPTDWGGDSSDGGSEIRGNYATFNPAEGAFGNLTLSNGNLTLASSANSGYHNCSSTFSPEGKKGYFEITCTNTPNFQVGVSDAVPSSLNYYNAGTTYISTDGSVYNSYLTTVKSGCTASFSTNDVLMFAFDFTGGDKKIWFGRNGTWGTDANNNVGNPATGANAVLTRNTLSSGNYRFYFALNNGAAFSINFGQQKFAYNAPSGFNGLSSQNITNDSDFVSTPDLVWIKSTSNAVSHVWADSLAGPRLHLNTDTTNGHFFDQDSVQKFKADGVEIGNGTIASGGMNTSGHGYASFLWNKGVTPGFDMVHYVGDGVNTRMIPHNLGKTPHFYITKNSDGHNNNSGFNDWQVYHRDCPTYTGNSRQGKQPLWLHSNAGAANGVGGFFNVPTSTHFGPNQINYDNSSGKSYYAYLWTEVPGFSRFGFWNGNSSADGPHLFCGFRPKLFFYKKITTSDGNSEHWRLYYDNGNGKIGLLIPSLTSVVGFDNDDIYFTSTGVKIIRNWNGINASGQKYVFAAWAATPFKFANATAIKG